MTTVHLGRSRVYCVPLADTMLNSATIDAFARDDIWVHATTPLTYTSRISYGVRWRLTAYISTVNMYI